MGRMQALIGQLDEVNIPAEILKTRKPIPKVDPVLKAEEALTQAVKGLEKKRKEMAGVRPLMHWEIDVPIREYQATDMAKGAREIFEAQAAVAEAHKKFEAAWDAWSI